MSEDNSISGGTESFMECEFDLCESKQGKDYVRQPKDDLPGWKGEPIFLCDKHSQGYSLDTDSLINRKQLEVK